MRTIYRVAALICAVLAALSLSGCALSALSAENVMEPPEAFGDGAEIQNALESALGAQITLRYPRSGEHRSAVVRADVDDDGLDEAIVFYRQATESAGARMMLLDTVSQGGWVITGEFSGAVGEIDRVEFGDMDGDGTLDIITGWSAYSDYGTLFIHSCAGGRFTTLEFDAFGDSLAARALSSYSELSVADFDGDGADELMTVCLFSSESAGEARLIEYASIGGAAQTGARRGMKMIGRVALLEGVTAYTGTLAGQLDAQTFGLAVDSLRTDGMYSSEIVLWDAEEKKLLAPVGEEAAELLNRSLPTESTDVDGDGFVELAGDRLLPDCQARSAKAIYRTDWYRYSHSGPTRVFSAVMRSDSGYYLILPDEWLGLVTAQPDAESRTLVLYRAGTTPAFSEEVMRITLFTTDEWEPVLDGQDALLELKQPVYTELATTEYYVYAVRIAGGLSLPKTGFKTVAEHFVLVD